LPKSFSFVRQEYHQAPRFHHQFAFLDAPQSLFARLYAALESSKSQNHHQGSSNDPFATFIAAL
jgi:hypothetical protein